MPALPAAGLAATATAAATSSLATRSAAPSPPTATAGPLATPGPPAAASPTAPVEFHLTPDDVRFEPDPQLYAGDLASIEVIASGAPSSWEGTPVRLYVDRLSDPPLAEANFAHYGLGGRLQATFTWVWDTRGRVGPQTIIVQAGTRPVSQTVTVHVPILPAEARPASEAGAHWISTESACCIFNYVSNTAAARDITIIQSQADAGLAHAEALLGVKEQKKIVFTLVSRLLGQGGFAAGEVTLSYHDRNPATSSLYNLFAHEATHILDRQIGQTRPTIMTEGLAVYVAGGHFQTEPLEPRAAALLALDRYIPLKTLADSFYASQHETSYLETGSFIQYLVDQYGWKRFKAMYASFRPAPSDAQMLDAGLQAQYGQGLTTLEAEWLAYLRSLPPDPAQVDNLRLTIALYDTIRQYQQLADPSAYFLTAWLPDGPSARQRGIVADSVRHPASPHDIALETMLVAAGQALAAGADDQTRTLLAGVNVALDAGSLDASPLAADQLTIVNQVLGAGYEPQRITLIGDVATVEAISHWPNLEQLNLRRGAGGWEVMAMAR
jgi:hypothetical protein